MHSATKLWMRCNELKNFLRRTNIFKSALNKKVTFFNRPWIWFKADWFRADWIRYQRLHVEWSIVIKISEKHFVCPFISWKALKMGLSSIFPLRNQSALNQSVLNQIQGWLKIVTLLFKTDLKIFLHCKIYYYKYFLNWTNVNKFCEKWITTLKCGPLTAGIRLLIINAPVVQAQVDVHEKSNCKKKSAIVKKKY